ncbi:MAG: YraN family protein [Oscillospiraceae bacterium]|nr:YraN family protein [Oscillospiraceae bacterium]
MKKTALGVWGEETACRELLKKGYRIAARNYRGRFGELDIVARKGSILAVVEVKLRKNADFGEAREYVTPAKQQKIRLTAAAFLASHAWAQELQPRFDVIEIYAPAGAEGPVSVRHWENAFE